MAVRISATGQALSSTSTAVGFPVSLLCWGYITTDRNAFSTFVAIDNNATTNTLILDTDSDGTTLNAYSDPGAHLATGPNMTVGTWYRIAVTVTAGGAGTLYYGAAGAALSSAAMSGTLTATGLTVSRAGVSAVSGEWLNGRVANRKTYTAELTAAEIEAEFAQYVPVRTANLYSWYPFLVGADLADYSGNGRTLTAAGAGRTTEDGPPIVWAACPVANPMSARARATNF